MPSRTLRLAGATLVAFAATTATAKALTPSFIAAYDTYVPGKGFEIKLVDVGTGQDIPLPSGVNTAADEFHPALSSDGRFLVFTRATVQPLLDGSVLPPANKVVQKLDRSTGNIGLAISGDGGEGDSAASITGNRLTVGHTPTTT